MRKLVIAWIIASLLALTVASIAFAGPTENTGRVTIPDEAKDVGMPSSFDGRTTANAAIPGP
ncbi:MAG: hypothetical protein HYX93_03055 [Chloroflexi bacterium]|nr:hypothetical protein [Chloroflexota bacterium]